MSLLNIYSYVTILLFSNTNNISLCKSRNESELVAHSKNTTGLEEKFGFTYVKKY